MEAYYFINDVTENKQPILRTNARGTVGVNSEQIIATQICCQKHSINQPLDGKSFEEAVCYALNKIKSQMGWRYVGLDKIYIGEGASKIKWQTDIYAIKESNNARVVIECKHWKNPIKKEQIGTLITRVADIGAEEGILIFSNHIQPGAVQLANQNGIKFGRMKEGSTLQEFSLEILTPDETNAYAVGLNDSIGISEYMEVGGSAKPVIAGNDAGNDEHTPHIKILICDKQSFVILSESNLYLR